MSDDRFEAFLQREAQSYNAPPADVPRDDMFAAVTAARLARSAGAASPERATRLPRYAWIGMAATLLAGVAIGRFALARLDVPPPATLAAAGDRADARAPLAAAGTAATEPTTPPAPTTPATPTAARPDGEPYARAATTELVRAEALLTAYRASPAGTGVDRQLAGWARDVLSNTRMLLDSPAADDPARRQLLRDLELVLVQMVQRSPAAGASEERAHIDRSLERTQMLSRLRSALPEAHNN